MDELKDTVRDHERRIVALEKADAEFAIRLQNLIEKIDSLTSWIKALVVQSLLFDCRISLKKSTALQAGLKPLSLASSLPAWGLLFGTFKVYRGRWKANESAEADTH